MNIDIYLIYIPFTKVSFTESSMQMELNSWYLSNKSWEKSGQTQIQIYCWSEKYL